MKEEGHSDSALGKLAEFLHSYCRFGLRIKQAL